MSRCDIVEAANPRDVEQSEIRYLSFSSREEVSDMTRDRTNAHELAEVAAELSPAGLETVLRFAREVRESERRGVVLLAAVSLEVFTREVQRVVDASPNGWPNKTDDAVFVSVAFGELAANGSTHGLDLDAFKNRLVEAHRASLLKLSRCDLVQAARAEDVDSSETAYLSARWHLIRRSSALSRAK